MITHNVFFKVKEAVSEEAIDVAFKLLFKLQQQLPGIVKITGGKCNFHESKGKGFFTHGFSIDFENAEAYDDFINNPITQSAKGSILNIAVDEMEGLVGFDMGEFARTGNSSDSRYKIQVPRLRLTPPGSIF